MGITRRAFIKGLGSGATALALSDVLSGVALAAGGFTMAAAIYIFNLKKFEPLLRPAKLSAFIGGMSVVTLESLVSSWAYGKKSELKLLSSLAQGLAVALLIYFAMKVTDLYARGATVWVLDKAHFFFYLELFGTVALPALLLSFREVRQSVRGLYWSAGLAAFGVVLNRFNVSLTSYGGYQEFSYFPSAVEIIITLALIAGGILIFDLGTRHLPIYQSELSG